MITNKNIEDLKKSNSLLSKILKYNEILWLNSKIDKSMNSLKNMNLSINDILDANNRLKRFAPYIASAFPETLVHNGIIMSPLKNIYNMSKLITKAQQIPVKGKLLLKCDSHLPISGSVKARGGIYEVLKSAESLAINNKLLKLSDDYSKLNNSLFKEFFSQYSIAVGSTGNLGLSIGIISSKIGFKVTVHMSSDAKEWKKKLLRSKGVEVIEYNSDYSKAVEEGRRLCSTNDNCYFIDDENSKDLFLGYSTAAVELNKQLTTNNIVVDENHPLFVYLPCGVGGGPGGITFGLKHLFGDNVHCFFVEPTHSPCMLLGCMTGLHNKICVQDFGIDNITDADGLAVGKPSGFVGNIMDKLLSGISTVEDKKLYEYLAMLKDSEGISIEPSAAAGFAGLRNLLVSRNGNEYLIKNNLIKKLSNSTHIIWATGGLMVPDDEKKKFYDMGKQELI